MSLFGNVQAPPTEQVQQARLQVAEMLQELDRYTQYAEPSHFSRNVSLKFRVSNVGLSSALRTQYPSHCGYLSHLALR